jgi:hypothetical protein
MNENLYLEPKATELEDLRALRRDGKRIIYDCRNAHVRDGRVICVTGKLLNPLTDNGSVTLNAVLSGKSSTACTQCWNYKG